MSRSKTYTPTHTQAQAQPQPQAGRRQIGEIAAPSEKSSLLATTNTHTHTQPDALENGGVGEEDGDMITLIQTPIQTCAPVPWTLVVPVYVDSFMDGLLIGLAAVAGKVCVNV